MVDVGARAGLASPHGDLAPASHHLKLVPPPEASLRPQMAALAYQNRLGETYYLHRGVTKTDRLFKLY